MTEKSFPTRCIKCDAQWSGLNTAHCASCHTTFTGITAFDAHRKAGACVPAESVGLSLTKRAYPLLRLPLSGGRLVVGR